MKISMNMYKQTKQNAIKWQCIIQRKVTDLRCALELKMLTADLRCSPNDTNTCIIAGLSVSRHSGTEALTISTCITRARVLHTVLIIWVWFHLWEHVMMLDSYIPHYRKLQFINSKSFPSVPCHGSLWTYLPLWWYIVFLPMCVDWGYQGTGQSLVLHQGRCLTLSSCPQTPLHL